MYLSPASLRGHREEPIGEELGGGLSWSASELMASWTEALVTFPLVAEKEARRFAWCCLGLANRISLVLCQWNGVRADGRGHRACDPCARGDAFRVVERGRGGLPIRIQSKPLPIPTGGATDRCSPAMVFGHQFVKSSFRGRSCWTVVVIDASNFALFVVRSADSNNRPFESTPVDES